MSKIQAGMSQCIALDCESPDSVEGMCAKHRRRWLKYGRLELAHEKLGPGERLCRSCGERDPEKFRRTGKRNQCKKCVATKQKNWRNENKEKIKVINRRAVLKRTYNLTLEQYESMVRAQNNLCAACGNPPTPHNGGSTLVVDHDHACCPSSKSCGKCIRGLLCTRCNVTLGHMRDDINSIRKLADYLESTRHP